MACTHAHTHTHVHTHVHTHTHTRACTHTHTHTHHLSLSLSLQVAPSANDQKIITMVTNYLRESGGVSTLTVQVEKERFLMSGAAVSYVRQSFPSTPPEVYVNYGPQTGEVKAV